MPLLAVFIGWPWLALIPAGVFFVLYLRSRRLLPAATALLWGLYAVYEYSMQRRWLCTGECNIRVDLLLLYPLLVMTSVAALVVAWRTIARDSRPG